MLGPTNKIFSAPWTPPQVGVLPTFPSTLPDSSHAAMMRAACGNQAAASNPMLRMLCERGVNASEAGAGSFFGGFGGQQFDQAQQTQQTLQALRLVADTWDSLKMTGVFGPLAGVDCAGMWANESRGPNATAPDPRNATQKAADAAVEFEQQLLKLSLLPISAAGNVQQFYSGEVSWNHKTQNLSDTVTEDSWLGRNLPELARFLASPIGTGCELSLLVPLLSQILEGTQGIVARSSANPMSLAGALWGGQQILGWKIGELLHFALAQTVSVSISFEVLDHMPAPKNPLDLTPAEREALGKKPFGELLEHLNKDLNTAQKKQLDDFLQHWWTATQQANATDSLTGETGVDFVKSVLGPLLNATSLHEFSEYLEKENVITKNIPTMVLFLIPAVLCKFFLHPAWHTIGEPQLERLRAASFKPRLPLEEEDRWALQQRLNEIEIEKLGEELSNFRYDDFIQLEGTTTKVFSPKTLSDFLHIFV